MNGVSMQDISILCRCCMKEMCPWDEKNFDEFTVEMFCYCTNIKIPDDDYLPKQFCNECREKITSIFMFIKEAQHVNITLRSIVGNANKTSVIIKRDNILLENTAKDALIINKVSTEKELKVLPIKDNFRTSIEQEHVNRDDEGNDKNDDVNYHSSLTNFVQTNEQNDSIETSYVDDNITNNQVTTDIFIDEVTEFEESYFPTNTHVNHKNNTKNETATTKKDFKEPSKVVENKEILTNTDNLLICPVCGRIFKQASRLHNHINKDHQGDNFPCEQCGKTFAKRHLLKQHMYLHSEERHFACDRCPARFKRASWLSRHKKRHSDVKAYACEQCGKRFQTRDAYRSHMVTHGEKTCLCTICGKRFFFESNLTVHLRSHTGERPYSCKTCGKRFGSVSGLRRHEELHVERLSGPTCTVCNKQVHDTSSLIRHMRTHTGERPYKCPSCARAFVDSWKRKVHLMRHHRVKLEDIPAMPKSPEETWVEKTS